MPLSNNSKYPSLRPSPSVKYFMVFTTLGVPDRAWVCSFIAGGWRGISMLFGWWRCGLPSQEDKEIQTMYTPRNMYLFVETNLARTHVYTHIYAQTNKQTNKHTNKHTSTQTYSHTTTCTHCKHVANCCRSPQQSYFCSSPTTRCYRP